MTGTMSKLSMVQGLQDAWCVSPPQYEKIEDVFCAWEISVIAMFAGWEAVAMSFIQDAPFQGISEQSSRLSLKKAMEQFGEAGPQGTTGIFGRPSRGVLQRRDSSSVS